MKLRHAIVAIILVVSFAVPAAAGQFGAAGAAHRRGDYATALRLLLPLAEQGDADAQSLLGHMYAAGDGVPQNYAEAAKWYREAADQGEARAQASLGSAYISGQGVPKDFILAYMWLNLSAARGVQEAAISRDIISEEWMTPAQIAEAQKLTREWKPTTPPSR